MEQQVFPNSKKKEITQRWHSEQSEQREIPFLEKICRPVEKKHDKHYIDLVGDMLETMYDACGVGLAAPQVGILKRIVVIDIGEGPIVLINPEILMTSGEQTGDEGCLSVPECQVRLPPKLCEGKSHG